MVLIKTVIDGDMVWIWRVGIKRFTLDIIVLEEFIIILLWNQCRATYDLLRVWLELLQPLESISLLHSMVVDITQECWIVSKTLVPSQEGIIESLLSDEAVNDVGN